MGNSYRLKSAQVILPLRVCSRWSHIPHRLRRALQKGTKKPLEQALRLLRSLLRRGRDSNPRTLSRQQFSRLP